MNLTNEPPSVEAQRMLEALQDAVAQSLERKKRLGQYAVVWEAGHPVIIGENAERTHRQKETLVNPIGSLERTVD